MTPPFYLIAASVEPSTRIVGFHGRGEELLFNIPRFRRAGFDVSIPDHPIRLDDDSLELRWGDRKLLRLFQDGTLVFRGRADHDFLGWGVEPEKFMESPRLNPVAVAEVHASFVHLYRRVLDELKDPIRTVLFKLSLKGGVWNGKRLYMTRYYSRMVDWGAVTRYPLELNDPEETMKVSPEDIRDSPNRAACALLETFASWFDIPEEDIAFVRPTNEGREIDIEEIKKL